MSIMSVSVEERRIPSLENVVANELVLEGGVRYDHNINLSSSSRV